jgi:hypothetical protein
MKEAGTITFHDLDSTKEAAVIVRYDTSTVALCVTLEREGDVEVVMSKPDARKLIDALFDALKEG